MSIHNYARRPRATSGSYWATEIASLYKFPAGDGTGQTIGLIELGGGYLDSDLQAYASKLGLPPINITPVGVDGAANNPDDISGASDEVVLDIQVAYGIAPKAAFRVYFGQNTNESFINCIKQAIDDGCTLISISWGAAEEEYSQGDRAAFDKVFQLAASKGVSVFASAGDSGYQDDPYLTTPTVDYPAVSPYVTAAGGTQLENDGTEVVWNNLSIGEGATGGGQSRYYSRPEWQTHDHIDKKNRCIPDVSANASPVTGWNIIMNGQEDVIGGTSAVSPMLAGLFARVNQALGYNVGFLNPILYSLNSRSLYDVTKGNNGYWKAGSGYDLASGLGRLVGTTLVQDISWAYHNPA